MSVIDSPRWYRALSLYERIELAGDPLETDQALGQRRMQDWRAQTDLNDAEPFVVFLDSIGVSESQFVALMGETDTSLQQRSGQMPNWLKGLQDFYTDDCPLPPLTDDFKAEYQEYQLLNVAAPIVSVLYQQLEADIQQMTAQLSQPLFDPGWVRDQYYEQFMLWLLWVLRRPMVLELNISRMQKDFSGDTSEKRYRQFIAHYSQSQNALEILLQYPEAARKIIEQISIFRQAGMRFLRRFIQDYAGLTDAFFNGVVPGKITDLKLNLSDPHRGGKRVFKVSFENGQQLIYKPKSLAVDRCFQSLLESINETDEVLPFKTVTVMDKGEYGWVEFVQVKPCVTRAELERFYQRQGINMALLYMLRANDFHYENLIADGEHPVLVDLETIYQPQITDTTISRTHTDPDNATVLSLGLLPYQTGFIGNRKHEVGGLGGASGQELTVRKLTGYNTDELRFTLQKVASPGSENLPQLEGELIDVWSMTDQIINGFSQMYQWIMRHRESLLAADSPLSVIANVEVRVIFRGTEQYSSLASACWHPDIVQNALFKDRLLAKLWKRGFKNSLFRRIYQYEVADMERGDVPLFSTLGNSHDLHINDQQSIPSIFGQTGEQVVNECLLGFSEMDQKRQQWLIRNALDSNRPEHLLRTHPIEPLPMARRSTIDKQEWLAQALKIGEHLADLMVIHQDKPFWFEMGLLDQEFRISGLKSMGMALYDGLPGMLLFFEHLARLTKSERAIDISERLLIRINQMVDKHLNLLRELGTGAFNGWPGLVYMYLHLAKVRNDKQWLDYANRIMTELSGDLSEPDDFDVISGISGTLLVLSAWDRSGDHPQAKPLIRLLADWLIRSAIKQDAGVGWENHAAQGQPLTGFAHGTSGVIVALVEAAVVLQEPAYLDTVKWAIEYEEASYSEQQQTWLDLRADRKTDDDEHDSFYAWCHGAPGIGLARVAAARCLEGSEFASKLAGEDMLKALRSGARRAAKVTLAEGLGGSHTLCHGDLGNLEMVINAADYLQDNTMQADAQQMAIRVLESIEDNGYRGGGVVQRELLGLMLGLAGIGYGLLKLYSPEDVPSVLLLETG